MTDATDIAIRREPGDLAELLRDVVDANRSLAERKGQILKVRAAASIPAAFDPDRLRDALDNIVGNAVKFSPPGAEIVAEADQRGDALLIRIIDGGPGLRPQDVPRLFGRFQRLSAQPTAGEPSTGMGLYSAKRIVDLHGGTITAVSNGAGRGSTFTVRLPVPPG